MSQEHEVLQKSSLFGGLSEEDLAPFIMISSTETLNRDEFLFFEGDSGEALYVIKSGVIEVCKAKENKGDEDHEKEYLRIAHLSEGDVIGEIAVFDDSGRSAAARASVYPEAELLAFDRNDFLGVLDGNPRAGKNLLRNLVQIQGQRLRKADEALRTLMRSLHYSNL